MSKPSALASVRSFMRPPAPREHCELCDAALQGDHAHLVEPVTRQLVCACDPCAILFSGQAATKYRRVPRRVQFLPDFVLTDETWAGLQLPIDLAFFLPSTPAGRVVAFYPSPAGATEASVPAEAWQALAEENPLLGKLEPDVEALLVNRVKGAREAYRVGIDVCYHLVGLIRANWRGFGGGPVVWQEIGRFFTDLQRRAARMPGHA